jgi:hypothetical protein
VNRRIVWINGDGFADQCDAEFAAPRRDLASIHLAGQGGRRAGN